MSGAVTAVAIGAGVGLAASKMLAPKAPKISAPEAPTPPPQEAKVADQRATRSQEGSAGGGYGPGAGSTLLTGAGGVDPNALLLGKNTLLGE